MTKEVCRRNVLARTIERATCRAANELYANALHFDVRFDVYNAADLIVIGVDTTDCRPRERNRYDSIRSILMLRVVVAVQLWLRDVAVDMAQRRPRTTTVGHCRGDHDGMSGDEGGLVIEMGTMTPRAFASTVLEMASGKKGRRTPLLLIFLRSDRLLTNAKLLTSCLDDVDRCYKTGRR